MYHALKMKSESIKCDNERLAADFQLTKSENGGGFALDSLRGRQLGEAIEKLTARERDMRVMEIQVRVEEVGVQFRKLNGY